MCNNKNDSPIVVALDYSNPQDAMTLVEQLDPQLCRVKVGKQLFTAAGPEFVEGLVKLNFDVFLDLKFHDIPATVAKACQAAADLGVWMINVHASGGSRMMSAAREAMHSADSPLLIAVSVLTSMNQEDLAEIGISRSVDEQVKHLAGLAHASGLDGMVCSAEEAKQLKAGFGADFKLVTPGIRLADGSNDDQRRVVTPENAISYGADYLVIGRAVTASVDPLKTLNEISDSLGVK